MMARFGHKFNETAPTAPHDVCFLARLSVSFSPGGFDTNRLRLLVVSQNRRNSQMHKSSLAAEQPNYLCNMSQNIAVASSLLPVW